MEKEEIIKKANLIMEETKYDQEKYHEERILIFNLLEKCNEEKNLELLENMVNLFEKHKKIELEYEDYKKLNLEAIENNIISQKVRKKDGDIDGIVLFLIEDIENNKYTFFTREHASKYIDENKERFNKDTEIKIIKNENMDIENFIFKVVEHKK